MHSMRAFLSSAVGLLLFVGLAAFPGALAPTPASAQDVLHEVQAGDDLRLIAGYYYGDTRMWERIWQANRGIVKHPNRIERGSYLRIPNPKPPAESYAEFVAQARKAAPPAAPVKAEPRVPAPDAEAQAPATPPSAAPPPAAPAKAPAPPATPAEPVKAGPAPPPVTAAAPAAPAQKPAEPAKGPVAPAPPAKTDAAKAPQPSPSPPAPAKSDVATAPPPSPPAAPPAKAPVPPAKKPLPPPPPAKEWYEELLSPDIFTSVEFLAGAGVLILGLIGLAIWRRRSAAQSEE